MDYLLHGQVKRAKRFRYFYVTMQFSGTRGGSSRDIDLSLPAIHQPDQCAFLPERNYETIKYALSPHYHRTINIGLFEWRTDTSTLIYQVFLNNLAWILRRLDYYRV